MISSFLKNKFFVILTALILGVLVGIGVGYGVHSYKAREASVSRCRVICTKAVNSFTSWKNTGDSSEYWHGVASYRAFMCLADTLYKERSYDYICFNKLYSYMLLYPERCQNTMDDLIAALDELSRNFEEPNTYEYITRYINVLEYPA